VPLQAPSRAYASGLCAVRLVAVPATNARKRPEVEKRPTAAPAASTRIVNPALDRRHEPTGVAPSQRQLLELQGSAGNAAVCQLLAEQTTGPAREDKPATVQRGFFGDLWKGITGAVSSVGSALSGAARSVGSALSGAVRWIGARFGDAAHWLVDLFRNLPERLFRFGKAIADGLIGAVTFIPEAIGALIHGGISGFAHWIAEKAKSGAAWLGTLVSRVFDLVGGPEAMEFVLHIISSATPLTSTERAAAQSVLGVNALRWDEVRIDQGGLLGLIFKFNQGRAFTTFHSINMTAADRADLSIVVHELTHVDQYEHAGSLYIGQALGDQIAEGAHAYDYGGPTGLTKDRAAGKHYSDYGRERQAQIAQDYYRDIVSGSPTTEYDPYIAELRQGQL
jgi:hypothetical protein